MKKLLAFILCFVYAAASSGATINFHYCMGKFIGWDISTPVIKCSNCGMQKKNQKGCCNDKQETLQLKKDQLAATVNDVPGNNFIYIQYQYPSYTKSFLFCYDEAADSIHGPPLIQPVSASIFNCVFRI